ncbi:tetratricopeptide repeat protein [Sphingomonas sp. TDK1]|uniref:tetratricopeptide repeat protein n=1 Tax=Sphingomonas sp. TDK1 TaxID=453247 RepID=UPI0018DDB7F1|nr:SEL1-like repeat protein [Sphingomonas sp. TDK1]
MKIDPSCRDYTLDTVQTNPDCAARVAKGEAAPSLAIAAMTLQSVPARRADAVQLLKRSAEVTGSPAVHYLLGSVLGTAQQVQPDYALAVRHLGIAAERGNPAAADLLASLLLAGKGAPRDVPRAISLYERAAANGFPSAAIALGKLYLAGKRVPKDEARGQAWLDAAAAANAPTAAQLAALAKGDTKVSNYQLIPSADPAKVKLVRYGTFDNPDIPPSFGFDPEFQKIHDAPYDDRETLATLEKGAAAMPTPYLYELARRLASLDPGRSLSTYLLARTRMAYDAARCADPAAAEALRAWDMVVAPDLRFLFAAGAPPRVAIEQALSQEATLPADTQPWWVCRSGMAEMSAAMNGQAGALKLKPASAWPDLRKTARAPLEKLLGSN